MNNNQNNAVNNRTNIIPHDSNMRGYSVENSFYDSPYNMDFEYGYLNLMFNITTYTIRTQDMLERLESNLSGIIELQNERRRLDYETRRMREMRENNQNSNIRDSIQSPQDIRQNSAYVSPFTMPYNSNSANTRNTQNAPNTPNTGLTDNLNYLLGRRNIFDSSNNILFSFLPRNVFMNPPTTTLSENTGRLNRRNRNGLTIQEIEDNTEIISYGSINMHQGLNTECPISRDTFTRDSVVLRLKECGHCFVPFRMMTWLESHSTCPLCRRNVVSENETTAEPRPAPIPSPSPSPSSANAPPSTSASTNTFSNIINNIRNSSNLDNLSIDNMTDESIMFSFDLPRSVNDIYDREFTDTYLSSLSQIFSNLNRNTSNPNVSTNLNASTNSNRTAPYNDNDNDNNNNNDIGETSQDNNITDNLDSEQTASEYEEVD